MATPILITGATKGIGRACALALGRQGYALALNARSKEDLIRLQQRVKQEFGTESWVYPADLATPEGRDQLCRAWNPLPEAAVLNVGNFATGPLLSEVNGLMPHLQSNFFAAETIALSLIRAWESKGIQGKIVLINSIASKELRPEAPAYSLSKSLLRQWAEALQKEVLPTGIQLCQIHPSATHTASWDGLEVDPSQLLKPEDVAAAVVHVLQAPKGLWHTEWVLRPGNSDYF